MGVRCGWRKRAGEMGTLGVLPLAGRRSGFHPSCFFPGGLVKSVIGAQGRPRRGHRVRQREQEVSDATSPLRCQPSTLWQEGGLLCTCVAQHVHGSTQICPFYLFAHSSTFLIVQ